METKGLVGPRGSCEVLQVACCQHRFCMTEAEAEAALASHCVDSVVACFAVFDRVSGGASLSYEV